MEKQISRMGAVELHDDERNQGIENLEKVKSRFFPSEKLKSYKDNCFCSEKKIHVLGISSQSNFKFELPG